jgi:hypothetical protein
MNSMKSTPVNRPTSKKNLCLSFDLQILYRFLSLIIRNDVDHTNLVLYHTDKTLFMRMSYVNER